MDVADKMEQIAQVDGAVALGFAAAQQAGDAEVDGLDNIEGSGSHAVGRCAIEGHENCFVHAFLLSISALHGRDARASISSRLQTRVCSASSNYMPGRLQRVGQSPQI